MMTSNTPLYHRLLLLSVILSHSTADIVSDVICSTLETGTGRQGLPDCSGYAVCESGFMMEMAQCDEGSMYDESIESCSVDKTECGGPPPTTDDEPADDPDSDEPTGQLFYPNWSSKKCDEKTTRQGLGVYYSYYDSRIACCSQNFISSIDELESCIGSTLGQLYGESDEEFPDGTGYVPQWGSISSCVVHTVDDDSDSEAWMKDVMKSKKYECCFEYVSWDLLQCMEGDASMSDESR
eukprot:scaffold289_cov144-Skeletonema_menzelii.AAC.7